MRSRRRGGASIGRGLGLGLGCLLSAAAIAAGLATPDPRLTPAEVVRLQLDALAHNDRPVHDAGIGVVWRFASPGNQSQTGPLSRFAQMVHDGYPEMLDHRQATLAKTVMQDGQALQGVELVDHAGVLHRYIFILTRQTEAPCRGCWMTDGVVGQPDERPAQSV